MGNFKNLGVGKTFNLGSKKLQVKEVPKFNCKNCFILSLSNLCNTCDVFFDNGIIPECFGDERKDKKNVVFVEVSQKGEK